MKERTHGVGSRPHAFTRLVLIALAVVVATGCMNLESTLTLRPDGSGEIRERVVLSAQMAAMMESMQEQDTTNTGDLSLFSEESVRNSGAYSGAELASVTMIDDMSGKGYESVYTFSDIRDVTFTPNPGDVMPDNVEQPDMDDGPGGGDLSGMLEDLDLEFTSGSPSTLTIRMPHDKEQGDAAGMNADMDVTTDTSEMDPQEMRMVKMMLRDARFRVAIQLDGDIVETNASHVADGEVTLFDLNFEEMVRDTSALKSFMKFGDQENADPEAISGLPGVKIETQEEISISFQ